MVANGKTISPTSKKLTTGSGKLRGSLIVVGWIWAVRWVAMGVVWWLFGDDFILAWFRPASTPLGP